MQNGFGRHSGDVIAMKREDALALLGLSDGPHKPIEVDEAFLSGCYLRRNQSRRSDKSRSVSDEQAEVEDESLARTPTALDNRPLGPYEDDVWDSLYLDWVHLPEIDLDERAEQSDKELLALRRKYLLTFRADEFRMAVERDYPNRISFSWDDPDLFDDIDSLKYKAYEQARLSGNVFSPMAFKSRLARQRTQAIFVDPSLVWIEGTEVERNEEGAIRPKLEWSVYCALRYISSLYGECGIANAMRIIMLRIALAFDNQCKILGKDFSEFELSHHLVSSAVRDISISQTSVGTPLGVRGIMCPWNWCGVTTAALRRAILGDESALSENYDDADELGKDLIRNADMSGYVSGGMANMIRAIRDLEGDRSICGTVGETWYTPETEAHDCLMESPECMTKDMKLRECSEFLHEYRMYQEECQRRSDAYDRWRHKMESGPLARLWSDVTTLLASVFGCALLALLLFSLPIQAIMAVYFDVDPLQKEVGSFVYLRLPVIGAAIGFLVGLLIINSWRIYLWWDKKLQRMRTPWNELLEIRMMVRIVLVIPVGIFAAYIISGVLIIYFGLPRSIAKFLLIIGALVASLLYVALSKPNLIPAFVRKADSNVDAVRSKWEAQIAARIKKRYPSLKVITNDRTVIRSNNSFFRHLEIDIWIPEIMLAIEANGEKFHDHKAYDSDVRNHTVRTREMYKEKYCERKGIRLLHVWDSEDMESIYRRIDVEINERLHSRGQ